MSDTSKTLTRWLTRHEAANHLRISLRTFDRRRREGHYRPSGSSSVRRPLWSMTDLDAAIDANAAKSNAVIDPIGALIDAS